MVCISYFQPWSHLCARFALSPIKTRIVQNISSIAKRENVKGSWKSWINCQWPQKRIFSFIENSCLANNPNFPYLSTHWLKNSLCITTKVGMGDLLHKCEFNLGHFSLTVSNFFVNFFYFFSLFSQFLVLFSVLQDAHVKLPLYRVNMLPTIQSTNTHSSNSFRLSFGFLEGHICQIMQKIYHVYSLEWCLAWAYPNTLIKTSYTTMLYPEAFSNQWIGVGTQILSQSV